MPGNSQILNEHWTGILPLAPPQSITPWILLSSVVLLLLVLSLVYFLWRRLPRQRALRALRQCQRQLQTAAADPKRIGLIVFRSYLQGMLLNPANSGLDAEQAGKSWQDFYLRMQQCVFQASPPAKTELASLIEQACGWLKRGKG